MTSFQQREKKYLIMYSIRLARIFVFGMEFTFCTRKMNMGGRVRVCVYESVLSMCKRENRVYNLLLSRVWFGIVEK